MPRVRRGFSHVSGGNGTPKYRKYNQGYTPKRSEATIDPPIVIILKFKGKCRICHKVMKKGSSAFYDGGRVWHEDCNDSAN